MSMNDTIIKIALCFNGLLSARDCRTFENAVPFAPTPITPLYALL